MHVVELLLPDFNFKVSIKAIANEETADILTDLPCSEGVSKVDYHNYLIEKLVEKPDKYLSFLRTLNVDRLEAFYNDLIVLIYEINPSLAPDKIVIVEDKLVRKSDAMKDWNFEYLSLPINPKWGTIEGDLRQKVTNPKLINDSIDELWDSIVQERGEDTYCKVWIETLKINIIIKDINESADAILENYLLKTCKGSISLAKKNRYSYIAYIASSAIADVQQLFLDLQEAGFLLAFSEQLIANYLYKAIIEVNPSLKWEDVDWASYKETKGITPRKDKPKPSCSEDCKTTDEPVKKSRTLLSSKAAAEAYKKFVDVSHDKILNLKDKLNERVIGQEAAINELCDAINVARVGLRGDKKPIGSFLFVGSTGVGKTELAKVLADELQVPLLTVDCSEYQQSHEIAKLFGAPPGYVGFEDNDAARGKNSPMTLASKIKKNPFSICLIDEIEKAHEDLYNVLLQIMDEGRITSGRGEVINLNQVILIITTNQGAREASLACSANKLGFGEDCRDFNVLTLDIMKESIHKKFKPEFLNRLTNIIYFNSLSKEVCNRIVDVIMGKVKTNLEKAQQCSMKWSKGVLNYICDLGFSEKYGARNLERTIDKYISLPLAEKILKDGIKTKSVIELDVSPEPELIIDINELTPNK